MLVPTALVFFSYSINSCLTEFCKNAQLLFKHHQKGQIDQTAEHATASLMPAIHLQCHFSHPPPSQTSHAALCTMGLQYCSAHPNICLEPQHAFCKDSCLLTCSSPLPTKATSSHFIYLPFITCFLASDSRSLSPAEGAAIFLCWCTCLP